MIAFDTSWRAWSPVKESLDERIAGINAYISARREGKPKPPQNATEMFLRGWETARKVYDPEPKS